LIKACSLTKALSHFFCRLRKTKLFIMNTSRRNFLIQTGMLTSALSLGASSFDNNLFGYAPTKMKIGLVTYLWGKDWNLPTLIKNCEKSGMKGVELRTEHAHGVEINLNSNQRKEVKKRFEDSPVEVVGYGSNYQYDNPDQGLQLPCPLFQAKDLHELPVSNPFKPHKGFNPATYKEQRNPQNYNQHKCA